MEQQIEPQQTAAGTEETYKGGPQGAGPQLPPMTEEEINRQKDALMKEWKKDLPFLRLQVELEELQIKAIQNSVMLGRRPANTVPGIIGAELMVREVEALHFLAQWRNEQDSIIQGEQEARNGAQEQKEVPATDEAGNDTTMR